MQFYIAIAGIGPYSRGGAPGARPPPPKIEKNLIFFA